jgi:hypothetical protein
LTHVVENVCKHGSAMGIQVNGRSLHLIFAHSLAFTLLSRFSQPIRRMLSLCTVPNPFHACCCLPTPSPDNVAQQAVVSSPTHHDLCGLLSVCCCEHRCTISLSVPWHRHPRTTHTVTRRWMTSTANSSMPLNIRTRACSAVARLSATFPSMMPCNRAKLIAL